MIALGKGVCSDELVSVNQPYLGRIGDRYLAVTVIDPSGSGRKQLPYTEAAFIDPIDRCEHPLVSIYELAPII